MKFWDKDFLWLCGMI